MKTLHYIYSGAVRNWKLLLLFIMVICQWSIVNQVSAQDAFYIYRNDGDFNGFFFDEVLRMGYSRIDLDSIEHDVYVVQEIELADTTYRIPLAVIDSIGFQQPEIKMNPRLTILNGSELETYLKWTNNDNGTMSFNRLPANLKPKVGDVFVGYDDDSDQAWKLYGSGFGGVVESVEDLDEYSGPTTRVFCRAIENMGEVFEQFITVEKLTIDQHGNMSRRLAGVKPDGKNYPEASGSAEVNLIDFTANLTREWHPSENSNINLSAEVGVKFRVRVTYDIGWTKMFVKLTRDLIIDAKPSLGMAVSSSFNVDVSDLIPLPRIIFPATCPIFETEPLPTWFIRGEGKVEANLNFPKVHLGLGEDIIIDTRRLFPIDYDLYWVPEENKGNDQVIDIGSTNVVFSGYLQTGIKFSANIYTASWYKKLLTGDISLDLYAGPKVNARLEFSTDWLNEPSSTYYWLRDQVLTASWLSLDLEASASAAVLWKDPDRKTFFSKNWSFFCDTLRQVPRIESIDVEVKNSKAKFTIKTERDLVPAHDVLYVDLYRNDKKVKTVEIGPYKRDGGPFTATISTDGMLGGKYTAVVCVSWGSFGTYPTGVRTEFQIPYTIEVNKNKLHFANSGAGLVQRVRFTTNAPKEEIGVWNESNFPVDFEIKTISESAGEYEAVFTSHTHYDLFPLEAELVLYAGNSLSASETITCTQDATLENMVTASIYVWFEDSKGERHSSSAPFWTNLPTEPTVPLTLTRDASGNVTVTGVLTEEKDGYTRTTNISLTLVPYHSEETGARYTFKEGTIYSYTHYSDSEKYTFSATILPSYYGEEGSHYTGGSYYSWGIGNLSYYTGRDKLQWGFSGYLQDANYHDVRIYGSVTKEESGSLQPGQKSSCNISIEYPK